MISFTFVLFLPGLLLQFRKMVLLFLCILIYRLEQVWAEGNILLCFDFSASKWTLMILFELAEATSPKYVSNL